MTTVIWDRAFIDAVIDPRLLENAVDWIASNMDPDAVFEPEVLEKWAEDNGYVVDDS